MLGDDPMSVALFYAFLAFAILLLCCTALGIALAIRWAVTRTRQADEIAGRHR